MTLAVSFVLVLSIYFLKITTTNGQIGNTFQDPSPLQQGFKVVQYFESGKCLNVYLRDISGDHHGHGKFTDTDKTLSGGISWSDWGKWWPTGGSESEILKVHLVECPGKSEKSAFSYDDVGGDHHGGEANDVTFTPFEAQTFHLLSGTPDIMPEKCVYTDVENFYVVDASKCDPGNPAMLFTLIPIPGKIDTHQIIHTASGLCFQISKPMDETAARLSICDAADLLQWWRICDLSGQCYWSQDEAIEPVGPGEQRSARKVRSAQVRGGPGPAGPPGLPGTPGGPGTRGGQGGTGGSGGSGTSDGGSGGSGGSGGPGGSGGRCGSGGQGAPGGSGGAAGPRTIEGYPAYPGYPGSPGHSGSTGTAGAAGGPGTPGGPGSPGGPGGSGGPGGQGGAGGTGGACMRSNSPASGQMYG